MKNVLTSIILTCLAYSLIAQSPIAAYDFFVDTVDVSANDNDLTIKGTPEIHTALDSCRRYMQFDSAGYMIKENPNLDFSNNEFTIAFWMKSADVTADQKVVGQGRFNTAGGDTVSGFVIGPENGKIKAEVFGGPNNNQELLSSSMLQEDTWTHIAMVFEQGVKLEIYINGQLDESYADPSTIDWRIPDNSKRPLIVGKAPWPVYSIPYTGALDDLLIYNQALSATQIDSIYQDIGRCPMAGLPIYVDSSATGANTGLTWTDAYTDLQQAIDLSCDCPDSDIWVAEGTYRPSQIYDFDENNTYENREKTFYIDHPVAIYGGFTSGETSLSERDSLGGGTILTGDLDDGVDTAYHVITMLANSIGSDWRLDGLTIRDGRADGSNFRHNYGGGIYADNATTISPMLTNCIITNNIAKWNGGGIFADVQGYAATISPMLTNCIITNNIANSDGGGIFANAFTHFDATITPVLTNCIITGNIANGDGGGIFANAESEPLAEGEAYATISPLLTNCTITNNIANSDGGGIYANAYAYTEATTSLMLTNCTITNNTAKVHGGGIYANAYAQTTSINSPELSNNIMWGNQADSGEGDAIWIRNAGQNDGVITHSLIQPDGIVGMIDQSTGNISGDPSFVDAANGDYRLSLNSPAIDAGLNQAIRTTHDLDGKTRLIGAHVDMGAYEYGGPMNCAGHNVLLHPLVISSSYEAFSQELIYATHKITGGETILKSSEGVELGPLFEVSCNGELIIETSAACDGSY